MKNTCVCKTWRYSVSIEKQRRKMLRKCFSHSSSSSHGAVMSENLSAPIWWAEKLGPKCANRHVKGLRLSVHIILSHKRNKWDSIVAETGVVVAVAVASMVIVDGLWRRKYLWVYIVCDMSWPATIMGHPIHNTMSHWQHMWSLFLWKKCHFYSRHLGLNDKGRRAWSQSVLYFLHRLLLLLLLLLHPTFNSL